MAKQFAEGASISGCKAALLANALRTTRSTWEDNAFHIAAKGGSARRGGTLSAESPKAQDGLSRALRPSKARRLRRIYSANALRTTRSTLVC